MPVLDRFTRYCAYDTQSDDNSDTSPSTEKQLALGRLLRSELEALGLRELRMDSHGRVFGTIPTNTDRAAPSVGFLAHMDTATEASGKDVRPRIVKNYDGGTIELRPGVSMDPGMFPGLLNCVGQDLVVTDGTTLLGADDKAGVAELMELAERLMKTDRPHGVVRIALTTDEEVGRGPEDFDVAAFGCKFAYTVDGGPLGELEYENFNAASCEVAVHGRGVHPGEAKNVMKNACAIAMELNGMLPAGQKPELTEGYEGFFHLDAMKGTVTQAQLGYLVRDHDRARFEQKKQLLRDAAAFLNAKYGEGTVELSLRDTSYNMAEKILPHRHLIDRAVRAFEACGVESKTVPIRGGTDGARLSYEGLPCPNLSTGGYNFHGIYEFIPVQSLERMPDVLFELACGFVE